MKAWYIAVLCVFVSVVAAHGASREEEGFLRMLRTTLKKHPEILLDALRDNSESVLDIAQQGSNLRRKKTMESQWREDLKHVKVIAEAGRPVLGPPDAPVRIVAFSDFTCPYCKQAAEVVTQILSARPTEVQYLFKHMPHGKDSPARLAADYFVAASLQSKQAAWRLYAKFFDAPERLTKEEAGAFVEKTALESGLSMKKLAADLKGKKVSAIIEEDLADAKKLGVEGTPYFLINNLVIRGAVSYEIFNAAVQTALSAAKK